jgi:ERCC4-type nuclease
MIVVDDRGHDFLRGVAEEIRRLPIGDAWIYMPGDAEPRKTYEVKTVRDFWSRVSRGEINFQLGVSALLLIGPDPPEEEFDRRRWFQVLNGVNRKVPVYRFVDEDMLLRFLKREEEHLMKGDYDVLELRAPKVVSYPEHVQALSVLPGVSAVLAQNLAKEFTGIYDLVRECQHVHEGIKPLKRSRLLRVEKIGEEKARRIVEFLCSPWPAGAKQATIEGGIRGSARGEGA